MSLYRMAMYKLSFHHKKVITFFLVYLLLFIPLNYYISVFLVDYLHNGFTISALSYGLAVVFGICSYFVCIGRKNSIGFFAFIILLFGTLFYFIIYPSNTNLVFTSFLDLAYNPFIILFAYCMPVFLIALSGEVNYKSAFNILVCVSRIVVIVLAAFFFFLNIGWKRAGGQYMTTSYYALPFICTLMVNHVKKKKILSMDLLISLLAIFMVAIGGSRGALVCVIVFASLLIFISCYRNRKSIWFASFFIILILFLLIESNNLFDLLKSFTVSTGFDSRTISKIEESSFFISNDRIALWSNCINSVFESPVTAIFGYGLWGDRPIINSYSHNIFVELFTSFGLLFGPIIFLLIFVAIVKAIINSSKHLNDDKQSIVLLAVPYGFFQLFFSDSFLLNIWFFLLVGIILGKNAQNKRVLAKGYLLA